MPKIPDKLTTIPATFSEIGAKLNSLIEWARKVEKTEGKKGVKFTATDHNIVIEYSGEGSSESNGAGFEHPFKVSLTDAAGPTATIIAESRIYDQSVLASATSPLNISNLTTPITLTASTKIWLKGSVSSLSTIGSLSITTTNPALPVTTAGSPAAQTEYHVLIGKVTASNPDAPGFEFVSGGTTYHFEQCLFSHLMLEFRTLSRFSTTPIIYPFPFAGI